MASYEHVVMTIVRKRILAEHIEGVVTDDSAVSQRAASIPPPPSDNTKPAQATIDTKQVQLVEPCCTTDVSAVETMSAHEYQRLKRK